MDNHYPEIEEGLKNLLEHNNNNLYLESLINLFLTVETFHAYEQAIVVFVNTEKKFKNYKVDEYSSSYISIIELLVQKFIYLSKKKQKQTKFITNIFYLYEILSHFSFENIHSSELHLIKKNYLEQYSNVEYSSSLQFFYNDLIFISDILNQQKEAFKDYLKRLMILNVHTATKLSYSDFVLTYIRYFKIDFETILFTMKELFEESTYFKFSALQRRSIFNWAFHGMWSSIPEYLGHKKWMQLYEPVKNIIFKHFEQDQIDEGMYTQFFLWHIMGNNYQTQEEFTKFNDEINKPLEKYYQQIALNYQLVKPKSQQKEKINIALVKDRIENTSPTQIELEFIKKLVKNKIFNEKYNLKIYSCNYFEKSIDNDVTIKKFNELGIKVINPNKHIINEKGYYHNHFEDAIRLRDSIIKNDTDIMIVAVSTFPAIDFLLINRTAPRQIYWSHGNSQYDVKGIDERISHFGQKSIFEFDVFRVDADKEVYNPTIDSKSIKKVKNLFPKDKFILGSIGRLVKIESEEYLETVSKIMKQNPNTIYLACGLGNNEKIREIIKKLDIQDRFYFTGFIDPHIYGHVIELLLVPFPLGGGEATSEYAAKGRPFLMLDINAEKSSVFGDARIYATDINDYVNVANNIIQNIDQRERVTNYVKKEYVKKDFGSIAYFLKELHGLSTIRFMEMLDNKESMNRDKEFIPLPSLVKKIDNKIDLLKKKNNIVMIEDFIEELSFGHIEQRANYNYILAEYFYNNNYLAKAKVCIERAWLFFNFEESILPLYIKINKLSNDISAIYEAYKRIGMKHEKNGNISKALYYFNQAHYNKGYINNIDEYKYDFDIIDSIERMAIPYRPNNYHKRNSSKKKIALVLYGVAHQNSSLINVNKIWLKNAIKENNEITIYLLDKKNTIRKSKGAINDIAIFCNLEIKVKIFDNFEDDSKRLINISKTIYEDKSDILLMGASMAKYEHAFIVATKPAPKTIGFLYGPPEQFCYPYIDEVFSPSFHPAMDSPAKLNTKHNPIILCSKSKEVTKVNKKALFSLNENSKILMSIGRITKFQSRKYWSLIMNLLRTHKTTYYVVIGINKEDIPHSFIDEDLQDRVLFFGWIDHNKSQELLSGADIILDTYPNGGGLTVLQGMCLDKPIVMFKNDYENRYNQNNWSLEKEFMNLKELVLERNFNGFESLVGELLENSELRASLGKKCNNPSIKK